MYLDSFWTVYGQGAELHLDQAHRLHPCHFVNPWTLLAAWWARILRPPFPELVGQNILLACNNRADPPDKKRGTKGVQIGPPFFKAPQKTIESRRSKTKSFWSLLIKG